VDLPKPYPYEVPAVLHETDAKVNEIPPGNAQREGVPRIFLPVRPTASDQTPEFVLEWIRAKAPDRDGRLYFRISEVSERFGMPKVFYHVVTAIFRQGMIEVERLRREWLNSSSRWCQTELVYVITPTDLARPIEFECYAPKRAPEYIFSKRERLEVWRRFSGFCYYCDEPVALDDMAIDHGLPRSRGGGHDHSNLVCSCHPCNSAKHTQTTEEYLHALGRDVS
jgi:hypothetical protein